MDYSFSLLTKAFFILIYPCITGAPDNPNFSSPSSSSSTLNLNTETEQIFTRDYYKNVSIAIIGAGFSGLSAARKLRNAGFTNVDIFEAENRIGGRVYPIPFENGYLQQGAEYINGQANPIFEMALRLGIVTSEDEDYEHMEDATLWTGECQIRQDLREAFAEFSNNLEDEYHKMSENSEFWTLTVGEVYEKSYEKFLEANRPSIKSKKIFDALSRFYKSYYETEWSSPVNKLALHNYAQWDDKSSKSTSFSLNNLGYKIILDEISKDIPERSIHLNSTVTLVDYTGEQTILTLANGTSYTYDYIIVTVPLGHLKKHARQMFVPHLPQKKLVAIDTLGFGSNLKVFLIYDKPFWQGNFSEEDSSVIVPLYIQDCGQKTLVSEYLHSAEPLAWNKNILVLWFFGEGPEIISKLNDDELNIELTEIFKNSLQNSTLLKAQKVIRTSWISNPNFYGTYSFITPEASKLSEGANKLLGRPVYRNKKPRILFAGEATHSRIYQTTIGAYLSGSREADRLINYLSCENS
uniref:Amine oxidase domain-containing protein n=1 Tax=Acrobeloides nanus TaxID=290746 RepID=A0A914CG45_9BILA